MSTYYDAEAAWEAEAMKVVQNGKWQRSVCVCSLKAARNATPVYSQVDFKRRNLAWTVSHTPFLRLENCTWTIFFTSWSEAFLLPHTTEWHHLCITAASCIWICIFTSTVSIFATTDPTCCVTLDCCCMDTFLKKKKKKRAKMVLKGGGPWQGLHLHENTKGKVPEKAVQSEGQSSI